jgi:gamma-D-glutamyl-L-lysine dipeptidyl-peptidase
MEKKYALINCTIASLRKETSRDSELVDEDFFGRKVQILSEPDPEWFQVKTHYDYIGFVHKNELILDKDRNEIWERSVKKIVNNAFADVMNLPKYQGHCIINLTKGAVVAIKEPPNENGWVKILLCDGRAGYIKEKFLSSYLTSYSLSDEYNLRKAIVQTALTYLGTQYRWGGKSPLGIDCSGLCSVAYMLNGVIIYRDASIAEGFPIHEIPYEEKELGDLLYFPGHIAMFLGNDKFIHATGKNGSDGVVINSLNPKVSDYREDLHKGLKAVGSLFVKQNCGTIC